MAEREYKQTPDWPSIIKPLTGNERVEIWQDGEQRQDLLSVLGGTPSAHAASHKFGGTDVVGTQDKTANAIPITDGDGTLDVFVSDSSTTVKGKVQLAANNESAANKAVQGNDDRLSNSRTPTAHAASHLGGSDNILGETSSTAYRGDRGKTAYDHSQATGNPHGTAITDIATLSGKITPLSDLSRVMRINGDGVHMFPDNVDGTVYKSNFATTDGWGCNNGVLSTSNGNLIVTASDTNVFLFRGAEYGSGKQYRILYRASRSATLIISGTIDGVANVQIKNMPYENANIEQPIDFYVSGNVTAIIITLAGVVVGDVISLSEARAGSGLYDTPVYGKDGQSICTNHGVVPVKGKRGKALLFQGAQYLQFDNPVIGTTGTIPLKVGSITSGLTHYILGNMDTSLLNGIRYMIRPDNSLAIRLNDGTNTQTIDTAITVSTGDSFVLTITGTNIVIYKNAVLVSTIAQTVIPKMINPLRVGNSIGQAAFFTGTIYDIGYDSRIWTQDDVTRYHNGDDAVDSQQKSVTPVPHSIMTRKSDGRTEVADGTATLDAINKGQLDAACSDFLMQSYTAGSTFTAGQLGYLHTDGKVYLFDANAEASAKGALYISIGAVTANNIGTFQRGGKFTTTGLTVGATYYGSETPGAITTTPPTTSGAIVRKIGFAQSSTVLFFNPSNDYVVLV